MTGHDAAVIVVGGGAAGIAAARRLHDAGIDVLIVEARSRLGGRSYTDTRSGFPLDLGCGWLHSADRNPWVAIAKAQGRTIDKATAPWERRSPTVGFGPAEEAEYRAAMDAFYARLGTLAEHDRDFPASAALEADDRWNALITAVGTYISGAELEQVSGKDLDLYDDSGVNWRVVEGYGSAIAAHAQGLAVVLGCPVQGIDHSGGRLAVQTKNGTMTADQVVVTLPTNLLAAESIRFAPALPDKVEASAGLPLGLADKLFLSLDGAEEFDPGTRLFGHTDRVATAAYHFRPFGRPMIEAYFAGSLAADLERAGEDAFFRFAVDELTGQLGNDFAGRMKPLPMHGWARDPFARGSYSYALTGKADQRAVLAAPVDDRLFFAGEACSKADYSTAHGAYLTGRAAAEAVLAARARLAGLPKANALE